MVKYQEIFVDETESGAKCVKIQSLTLPICQRAGSDAYDESKDKWSGWGDFTDSVIMKGVAPNEALQAFFRGWNAAALAKGTYMSDGELYKVDYFEQDRLCRAYAKLDMGLKILRQYTMAFGGDSILMKSDHMYNADKANATSAHIGFAYHIVVDPAIVKVDDRGVIVSFGWQVDHHNKRFTYIPPR